MKVQPNKDADERPMKERDWPYLGRTRQSSYLKSGTLGTSQIWTPQTRGLLPFEVLARITCWWNLGLLLIYSNVIIIDYMFRRSTLQVECHTGLQACEWKHSPQHVYICIYVYMYICIYVYMYICIYVYMYIYICIYMYIYVYMYICIYVYMYICICIYICIYMYTYMSIYYTYILLFILLRHQPEQAHLPNPTLHTELVTPGHGGLAFTVWRSFNHSYFMDNFHCPNMRKLGYQLNREWKCSTSSPKSPILADPFDLAPFEAFAQFE